MNVLEELKSRKLPEVFPGRKNGKDVAPAQWQRRRQEIRQTLCREEYGFLPPPPAAVASEVLETDDAFCAGNALLQKVRLKIPLGQDSFSFPVSCALPKKSGCPVLILINFRDNVPDLYLPSEEICDHGFAVVSFGYQDVTSDDGDFSSGLAGKLYQGRERKADDPGKIAIWAWAAMRVMDYVQGLDGIVGHSRLGKTALVAGAFDDRFAFVISNNSGCSGAAVTRGKCGEKIPDIFGHFPYWFCGNYGKYAGREDRMPFDQHFLLSLTAPRKLYVCSSEEDSWSDPVSEYLGCVAADEVYRALGLEGFVYPDRLPRAGDVFQRGSVGYHLRGGKHYLSRYDWLQFMNFVLSHRNA